jgi:citronellol/citronellal dehydrogenase
MRVLSVEWARHGIRLNAIAAGAFATDTFTDKYPASFLADAPAAVPLGRLGRPEELAWMVAYLASPAGDYVSGSVLTIDGARDDHQGAWPPPSQVDANGRPVGEERRERQVQGSE